MEQIVTENQKLEKRLETSIQSFFKKFRIGSLLNQAHFKKSKGFSCLEVLKFLFSLIYRQKHLSQALKSEKDQVPFGKDVVYRFLNSVNYNWEKFLSLLSQQVVKKIIYPLTNKDRTNVLIFDDTLLPRNRSKKVEMLSRVFDHVTNTFKKGFRLLTMGWSDGNTFIPLALRLLCSSENKKLLYPANDNIDKRTNAGKRRAFAKEKATDSILELIKLAIKQKIPVDYVLFDGWFAFPVILKKIRILKKHVIARLKATSKIFYTYNGRSYNLTNLYAKLKKKRGRAKILTSVTVIVNRFDNNKPLFSRIVFVRNRNKKNKWIAFISTDLSLSDEEIIRIYAKRWSIEVFFKVCKSYLSLVNEFQGRSYDLMVAHATIVFVRYILLAVCKRENIDDKTIGELFMDCIEEIADIQFLDALTLILQLLKNLLKEKVIIAETAINKLLEEFISSLPPYFQPKLRLISCET